LLDAFLDMTDAQENNWELHFVGNVGHATEDDAFVRHLQEKARDRSVHFHFGLSLEHLRDLYRRASIYWHATGFGYDASEFPLKQEHFGMTIVEAMSAGVVPLARNAGGPRETIDHGRSGFLWSHLDELLAGTRALIADETLREAMSNQAMAASERFTRGQFLARLDAIIDQLTSGRREVPVCAS
jgi:glycosyltransferase involved in cell wall biosynthesis